MRLLARDGKRSDVIRRTAIELTSDCDQKSWSAEIFALFDFVQNCIRYQRDTTEQETLATPVQVLAQGAGDCDDKSTLLAALLESIGHPTRFFAMGFHPGDLTHVIVETRFRHRPRNPSEDQDWLPLDTTENRCAGWLPPGIQQRMYIANRG